MKSVIFVLMAFANGGAEPVYTQSLIADDMNQCQTLAPKVLHNIAQAIPKDFVGVLKGSCYNPTTHVGLDAGEVLLGQVKSGVNGDTKLP